MELSPLLLDDHAGEAHDTMSLELLQEHIQHDQDEIKRLSEFVVTMSGLANTVQSMESWTSNEQRLVAHALAPLQQFALTSVALESHAELTQAVALESIGDSLRRAWEAIKRVAKRIWDKIMSFFKARDVQTVYIRERMKRLHFTLDGLEGSAPITNSINVGSSYYHLGKGHAVPQGAKEVLAALTEYNTFVDHVYNRYVAHLEAVGHELSRAFDEFNTEKVPESVDAINHAGLQFAGEHLYQLLGATKKINHADFPGELVHSTITMVGGRVGVVVEKERSAEISQEELTSTLTQTRALLTMRYGNAPTEGFQVVPFAILELKEIIHATDALCNQLDRHRQVRNVERLAATHRQLTAACDRLHTKTTSHPELVARTLQYAVAFSTWSLHPIMEVSGSIQQIANQVMAFVNANTRAYRPVGVDGM